jgi:positive regulator of sigma E activity
VIEQQGRIIALDSGMATIEVGSVSGCSACESGVGCGAGIFAQLLRRKKTELIVSNEIQAKRGEVVIIGIPERLFMSLLFRLYLVPLLSGLAGAVLGFILANAVEMQPAYTDMMTLIGAVLFLTAGLLFGRKFQQTESSLAALELLRPADAKEPGLSCMSDVDLNRT